MNDVSLSKLLSRVLRHEPERLGLRLDAAGWVPVDALLAACERERVPLTREKLAQLVAASDKQRFAFDETRTRLRANQGHSVAVELGYEPKAPPETLYHGTVDKFLPSIRAQGLRKGGRHHVHLSADVATAVKVGSRRGRPVILTVRSGAMHRDGHAFFLSANGVWLVDTVPTAYLAEPD
ncbi:MAG: RNA 2'-phosphotransferase [Lacunisphaera sp.]